MTSMIGEIVFDAPSFAWDHARKEVYVISLRAGAEAWQIPVWICCDRPGDSYLLLMGGQHGDEYQGPSILREFLCESWNQLHGNVIVIPSVNPPAYEASRRCSPLDGENLNRSFPGSGNGSMTQRIAHVIASELLPHVHTVLDIHSGGDGMDVVPSIMTHHLQSESRQRETLQLIRASGIPLAIVVDESHKPGMFDTFVEAQQKIFLCAEIGGGHLRSSDLQHGRRMVQGIVSQCVPEMRRAFLLEEPAEAQRLLEVGNGGNYVQAMEDGLFCPFFSPGHFVQKGQTIGNFYPAGNSPSVASLAIQSPVSGSIYMIRVSGVTRTGEDLIIIAEEASAALHALWVGEDQS